MARQKCYTTDIPEVNASEQRSTICNKSGKAFWGVLLTVTSVLAVFQCYSILIVYLKYPVMQQIQPIFNQTLQFPAITVCSNNPVVWPLLVATDHPIYQAFKQLQDKNDLTHKNLEPLHSLLAALRNTTEEERIAVSTSKHLLLELCVFAPHSCVSTTKYWYTTNSLFYGNCLTFNHVVNPDESVTINGMQELVFHMYNELGERMPNLNRNPVLVMVIHPVGTAPVITHSNVIELSAGEKKFILLEESVIQRLPHPYPSHCVDSLDPDVKKSTVYYKKDREYIYSFDACLQTCSQMLRIQKCKCIDAIIPIGFLQEKYADLPFCTGQLQKLHKCFVSKANETNCNCRLPCRETVLSVKSWVSSIAKTQEISKTYNAYLHQRKYNNATHMLHFEDDIHKETQGLDRALLSAVLVRFKSTTYEMITEVPLQSTADLFGVIGGNVGLWLGISVLSLYDIIGSFVKGLLQMWATMKIKQRKTAVIPIK